MDRLAHGNDPSDLPSDLLQATPVAGDRQRRARWGWWRGAQHTGQARCERMIHAEQTQHRRRRATTTRNAAASVVSSVNPMKTTM
jgi:hypothetical protein